MQVNAIKTRWAAKFTSTPDGVTVGWPAVTPTMATMNSLIHIPAAPMRRSFLRPTRSMSWTPKIVITVLTTSAIILQRGKELWAENRTAGFENLRDDEGIPDSSLLEERLKGMSRNLANWTSGYARFHSKLGILISKESEVEKGYWQMKLIPVSCCHYIVSLSDLDTSVIFIERTPCIKIPVHVLRPFLLSLFLKQSRYEVASACFSTASAVEISIASASTSGESEGKVMSLPRDFRASAWRSFKRR